jgi:hypothetical protein
VEAFEEERSNRVAGWELEEIEVEIKNISGGGLDYEKTG